MVASFGSMMLRPFIYLLFNFKIIFTGKKLFIKRRNDYLINNYSLSPFQILVSLSIFLKYPEPEINNPTKAIAACLRWISILMYIIKNTPKETKAQSLKLIAVDIL